MITENQKKPPKILVIGSKGHPREIQCYDWIDINKIPNVADQDVVIINMTSLKESLLDLFSFSIPSTYLKSDYFLKLLQSKGQVFIIAEPTIYAKCYHSYWWSPWGFCFKNEKTDTLGEVADPLKTYFENVKSAHFTLEEPYVSGNIKDLGIHRLAQTRYYNPVGLRIDVPGEGKIYLLPPPTEISVKAAIDILLEKFFGIKTTETAEPDFVKDVIVPGESKIQGEIQQSLDRIKKENGEIENLNKKLKEITKFKKLLYAEDEELQQTTWAVFRELGAQIIEPQNKNEEDGWVVYDNKKGVLEIKKDSKSANKKHTRQLDEWVGNCIANEEKCKGILVINHYGDKPLNERGDPFPGNVRKHAKDARPGNPMCLLTTIELFNAFCAFKESKITAQDVLKKIFEANGEECKLMDNNTPSGTSQEKP